MIELIVEDLHKRKVATVTKTTKGTLSIITDNADVKKIIAHVIKDASEKGIPLRFDKRQKTQQGIKFQRFVRWVTPDDQDFLEALAEDLSKHELFAYTVEPSLR